MKRKGFTLIEMMIVVAIIAILAGMAIPQYTKYVQKSRATEAVKGMKQIADAEVAYYGAKSEYITNKNPLLVELDEEKFTYNIFSDTTNCFLVQAIYTNGATNVSADNKNTLYLLYPSKGTTKASACEAWVGGITDATIVDQYWNSNVYYGCYYESCTSNTP